MQRSIAKNLSKNRFRQMELLQRSLDEKAINNFSDNLSVENYRRPNAVSTRNVSRNQIFANKIFRSPCDVFINHRGVDTKRTVASLLYDHLHRLNLRPFLDNKNMKPGDKLFDKINDAVKGCKIGVLVFSPRYCESYWCLHELALMMETKKKVIPIFCDVKPSELGVVGNDEIPVKDIERFEMALEEAKYTVGLTFDSEKGNWADVATNAANIVMQSMMEVDEDDEKHIY